MRRRCLLALLLAACSSETAREDSARAPSSVATRAGATAGAGAVAGGVAGAMAGTPAAPKCPASGLWTECAVLERLERAGLVPRRDSAPVSEAPLTVPGIKLLLGTAELEVYLFPSASARERAMARIDTTRYLGYTEAVSMQQLPTLIQGANLAAILHSRNDHQRERIGDALTAGPPQPAPPESARRLPPTTTTPNVP